MPTLATPLERIPKVSRRILPALRRLGIVTVRDLLMHFPSRYQDFSETSPIDEVQPDTTVTIHGVIQRLSIGRTKTKRMTILEARVEDESGSIKVLWFNQPFLGRTLKIGDVVQLSGKAVIGPRGLCLQNPAYERMLSHGKSGADAIHTGGLVPVYPETEGITSRWLRFLIHYFLPLTAEAEDPLPAATRERNGLSRINEALVHAHFPQTLEEGQEARKRFSFEELLLLQLRSFRERTKLRAAAAPTISQDIPLLQSFTKSLPFSLTDAQRKALWEITRDMEKPYPMNRLLEGDVGSGKTVVVAGAALAAACAGWRVACMAPTEILARQHYETFKKLLASFPVHVGLRIGSEKRDHESAEIVIGTHALLQRKVKFDRLGLVIVDEQHRFGVEQRATLLKAHQGKDESGTKPLLPHFLSMSATPIPRTLALAIYGDLDLSILNEVPKTRKPIITRIVGPNKRKDAYAFVEQQIRQGRQAFIVCPLIEQTTPQSGKIGQQQLIAAETKAVKEEYRKLSEEIFPHLRIGMLHGKIKPKEKEEVMRLFQNRGLDMLVATSVIEVGVDVPNATVMLIEGAERFGLAQLHQFRGRVGRGEHQSYCLLLPTEDGIVTRRLRAVATANDGFRLAEEDLAIRGPGSMFGTRQWGISDIALEALRNPALVSAVRTEARTLAETDPSLSAYPLLKAELAAMERTTHLE